MAGTTFACPKCGSVGRMVHPKWDEGPTCLIDGTPLEEAGPWGKPLSGILRYAESEKHSQARAGGNYYREIDYGLDPGFVQTNIDRVSVVRDVHQRRADQARRFRNA